MKKYSFQGHILLAASLTAFVVIALGLAIIEYDYGTSKEPGNIEDKNKNQPDGNVVLVPDESNKNPPKKPWFNLPEIPIINLPNKPIVTPPDLGTGEIFLEYTEARNGIMITGALPMSDTIGKTLAGSREFFDFSVNSRLTGNAQVEYEIAIVKDPTSTLLDSEMRLYLTKVVGGVEQVVSGPMYFTPIPTGSATGSPAGSMVMARITDSASSNTNYRLRMWIAEETILAHEPQFYAVKVNVYGKAVM